MTATGHAVLGAIIAAKVGNPSLAIPLALVSHVVTDIIPHWDVATNGEKKDKRVFWGAFLDVILGFVISFFILFFFFPQTNLIYAFFIILASQSFDWLMTPYYFFNIKLFKWVYEFQKKFDNSLDKPWGILTQVIVLLSTIALAKIF